MNIEVVRLVSQEIMIHGWSDKEKVLLLVLDWRSRQLSNVVNQTRHCGKVVRLDHQDQTGHRGQSAQKLLVSHESDEIIDTGEKDGAPTDILEGRRL